MICSSGYSGFSDLSNSVVSAEEDPVFLLRLFYDRFFPYKTYFQWLNYDTGMPIEK